jgi:hypothetical protein
VKVVVPKSQALQGIAKVRVVDSISELLVSDAGCVAVSGSHGGLSAARFALAVRPALSVFNDAGVGKEAAGVAGLALLQHNGLAACCVAHTSARIGDAQSTLNDGIISHTNELARQMGIQTGQAVLPAIPKIS